MLTIFKPQLLRHAEWIACNYLPSKVNNGSIQVIKDEFVDRQASFHRNPELENFNRFYESRKETDRAT